MADKDPNAPAKAAAPPGLNTRQDGVTRRQMLRSGMFATIGAMFATVGGGTGLMFWPIKLTGFGSVIPVPQKLSEIKDGEVVTVRDGKFYLARFNGEVIALYWKCVHLGCTVPWVAGQGQFVCPCHGSVYEINGQNVAGPAPRPLDQMAITIDKANDMVLVNTGKVTKRAKHLPEHATKV